MNGRRWVTNGLSSRKLTGLLIQGCGGFAGTLVEELHWRMNNDVGIHTGGRDAT
jgi:hypothetical protein